MDPEPTHPESRLRQLAGLFLRLGFTAFGGPAAHVALMEDQIVTRRQWLDRQHFLDLVAAVNFIPGPNSTELAIHIGQIRAGLRGLIVAGVCFIAPAMLIILPIAWAYVIWGTIPQMLPALRGIGAAVVAIVAFAVWRLALTAIKDQLCMALLFTSVMLKLIADKAGWPQPELIALAVAAVVGAAWYSRPQTSQSKLLSFVLPITFWPDIARLALVLLKIGATLFGSGYVLVSYLQTDMVDHRGWLTARQLTDAFAVGQFTPGPLLTTATFVGYLLGNITFGGGIPGGIIGGVVATIAIFLPSFILVAIFGPMLQKIRQKPWARGALDGMNAAVVGLMIVVTMRLATVAIRVPDTPSQIDWLSVFILIASFIAIWRKINTTCIVPLAGLLGWLVGRI